MKRLAEKSLNTRKDFEGVVAQALILSLLRSDERWITDISIKGLLEKHAGFRISFGFAMHTGTLNRYDTA